MKRHSRPEVSATDRAPSRNLTSQLDLPFAGPLPVAPRASASRRAGPAQGSRSRRELRPAEAPREVRLPRTIEDETDGVAASLGLYLPPGKTLELCLTNHTTA